MAKQILFDSDARTKLKQGIDLLAKAVRTTLGPKGRNVVIDNDFGVPHITKDGVTVAKAIVLEDPVENMGAQMMKEVASKTVDSAGDGTTTSTVLAQSLIEKGMNIVVAGANPMDVKRGIDKAVDIVVDNLKNASEEIGSKTERLEHVATISANNDPVIGKIVAEAIEKVGNDGVITVEVHDKPETELKIVEGMQFDRGYTSPYFATNQEKRTAEYEDVSFLITDNKINELEDILAILEEVSTTKTPLVIIAPEVEQKVQEMIVMNRMQQGVKIVMVKAPEIGQRQKDILEDIALLTDGVFISSEKGLDVSSCGSESLGTAKKVVISEFSTIITGGASSKETIEQHVQDLKDSLDVVEGTYFIEGIKQRIAKLAGGIGVIKIGAATEVELLEKKDRADDALAATRAAVEEGIVPGGGIALLKIAPELIGKQGDNPDQTKGIEIVRSAIETPFRQICLNCGKDDEEIYKQINYKEFNQGYNAKDDIFVDMIESGIIDPVKVTKNALINAASVAGMILTTDCTISVKAPKDEPVN